jgi:Zn-dependent M16 (insulinase) family peptidase
MNKSESIDWTDYYNTITSENKRSYEEPLTLAYCWRLFDEVGVKNLDLAHHDENDDYNYSYPGVYLSDTKVKVFFFNRESIDLNLRKGLPLIHDKLKNYMKNKDQEIKDSIKNLLINIKKGVFGQELIQEYLNKKNIVKRLFIDRSETLHLILDSLSEEKLKESINSLTKTAEKELEEYVNNLRSRDGKVNVEVEEINELLDYYDKIGLDKDYLKTYAEKIN